MKRTPQQRMQAKVERLNHSACNVIAKAEHLAQSDGYDARRLARIHLLNAAYEYAAALRSLTRGAK